MYTVVSFHTTKTNWTYIFSPIIIILYQKLNLSFVNEKAHIDILQKCVYNNVQNVPLV